uniref:Molybdopterin synthase sulfur carrier subunit n=1 Tax=Candidatus Kentrum sp. TC TaxID=2126339 RepID=A0A451A980_9GAMM|nr:MAG: molybdopterin synthase catalytic subunit/molybdopterin synthase sulfur carrier subunit [Candidatus Kentron sp. TC]VFK51937.1 MAG: molybdopterin synthase catalytic subunit/molybdopterin synthase sulfur carrier subunit [Candidatus Kentron sp. TC]VFK62578.1 MAG: molybdopterin synthase catalytic subunit/molybdopterin synthase sulfur carrier subunit [Candidatus Kentron sp. TC]
MSQPTQYTIKLFASLKEHVGREEWVYEGHALTAKELLHGFFEQYPELGKLRTVTRVAVNQSFCHRDSPVNTGDEIALIPPVSGG